MVSPTYHVRLKTSGSQIKRIFFDFILSQIDIDYPNRPECVLKFATHTRKTNPPQCLTCGGRPWTNPLWKDEHLKKLARQINAFRDLPGQFGVKIKRFELESKCPQVVASVNPSAKPGVAAVTVGEMM